MKTEIFVACDFAADYAGKLTLASDPTGSGRELLIFTGQSHVAQI
jgi:hypothetical protein